jgi:uncharacterized protein (TIGR02246 family)
MSEAAASPHSIEILVRDVDEAFARGDLDAVVAFFEPNAALVTDPTGKLARGADEIRSTFRQFLALGITATQVKTHVIEAGDLALFLSHWSSSGKDAAGQPFTRNFTATVVFRRQSDGAWRAVIDNSFGPMILGPR